MDTVQSLLPQSLISDLVEPKFMQVVPMSLILLQLILQLLMVTEVGVLSLIDLFLLLLMPLLDLIVVEDVPQGLI